MADASLFDQELSGKEINNLICIAFAALINAYGKPVHVSTQCADALPEHFKIMFHITETGRTFWIEEDTTHD